MEEYSPRRATPEDFLRQIKNETGDEMRGKLKIFFGYAAGVGKTYAMLEAAHHAQEQGIDVVAGYIEPHTRPQTMELLEGLELLKPLEIQHKGITLREFDLDAAIERRPQLILVDELAHTNADTCRHVKRYQDIEELLKAGINVYTTVNVQHIESLNDIVASITGITVRERIPDKVFDDADQVELVDIEPDDLIARLNEGKIYRGEGAKRALDNFFTVENLVALREIALRRTADRVNKISERKKKVRSGEEAYFTEENILVCLSSSPSNAKIIRAASRMAKAFSGRFTALFVETPDYKDMGEENHARLRSNLKLAEQLGAAIDTVYGEDVAYQIAEYARQSGVSKIILGRSNTKKRFLFSKPSLSEKLTVLAPNMDIYIIPDQTAVKGGMRSIKKKIDWTVNGLDIVKSVFILLACTGIGFGFRALGFESENIIAVYTLGMVLVSIWCTRRIYGVLWSLIGVFIFNYFFSEPLNSMQSYDTGYPLTFVLMVLSSFIIGTLALRIRKQAKRSAQTAYRTKLLLDTDRVLQQTKNSEEIVEATAQQLIRLLDKPVVFYLPDGKRLLPPRTFQSSAREEMAPFVTDNEAAVAQWVYKNNKHAGATTNTLSASQCLYLAIRGTGGVVGVVGIGLGRDSLEPMENNLVLSMLGECAMALEKDLYSRKREEAAMQAQREQLRANLLRSISHDLRTPLTSISGNADVLLSSGDQLEQAKRRELYRDIYEDSRWLIDLVENLLSITRIEDGSLNLNMKPELVNDVIDEAVGHFRRDSGHEISIRSSDDFVLARMDARLIVQVIVNIVGNALKYTPEGSKVEIAVHRQGKEAVVDIADDGPGITDADKDKIFDMFFTANKQTGDSRRGLGLGLALCKSVIEAHGGKISVHDHHPNGTVFRFTLPCEEVQIHE